MTAKAVQGAEEVVLPLRVASAGEYCRAILSTRRAEMWWWQTGLAPYAGFSRPFEDRDGLWWWRIKVQFSWALDFFCPLARRPRLPVTRSWIGCQYPVPESEANSLAHFNVIHELAGYDLTRVASQKRRAVRKGLKLLELGVLDSNDRKTCDEACEVWNSHVQRTGWNSTFSTDVFAEHWRPLADTPGTRVLGARRRSDGVLCAWLIARGVEGTVYCDTIASHTDRLEERPNDALIYSVLWNAARTAGLRHANYFLRSNLEPLERFKQSLGFDSSGIPSRVRVNPLIAAPLRVLKPGLWKRLHGDWPRGSGTSAALAGAAGPDEAED